MSRRTYPSKLRPSDITVGKDDKALANTNHTGAWACRPAPPSGGTRMNSQPVTVIHFVGPRANVKTCTLSAPHIAKSMVDGGVSVVLSDQPDGPETGRAYFTAGGIVLLAGVAKEQYKPLTQPEQQ